jgi:hypothetical protein
MNAFIMLTDNANGDWRASLHANRVMRDQAQV